MSTGKLGMFGMTVIVAAAFAVAPVRAEEPIKVGMVLEMSGPFADIGRQILDGARAYMKANGDTVAGRRIERIVRDTTRAAPEIAKRQAQQLSANNRGDFLARFCLTPNALAPAPVPSTGRPPLI